MNSEKKKELVTNAGESLIKLGFNHVAIFATVTDEGGQDYWQGDAKELMTSVILGLKSTVHHCVKNGIFSEAIALSIANQCQVQIEEAIKQARG
jgi:hypothetical protein